METVLNLCGRCNINLNQNGLPLCKPCYQHLDVHHVSLLQISVPPSNVTHINLQLGNVSYVDRTQLSLSSEGGSIFEKSICGRCNINLNQDRLSLCKPCYQHLDTHHVRLLQISTPPSNVTHINLQLGNISQSLCDKYEQL